MRVPVKLAALEMVWPLMRPEVMVPAVKAPMLPFVEKRLVEEAVVEKRLVVVAFEVVALRAVKFWRVVDPLARRLRAVRRPVRVSLPPLAVV